ncbi:MAG: hypothetical protein LBR64_06375, partial [Dysgonamonadaceae bacterium]|nr:hypothetical protein [Dysgonamonadaceae bacterium]
MKRTIFLATLIIALAVLGAATGAKAQVTIGSMDEPKATLDVRKGGTKADGIIAPVLTGNELKGNDSKYGTDQTGAIVYVTAAASPTTTKTANVTAAGYYYFDGSVWQSLKGTDGGGGGTTYSAGTNISILGSAIHALDTATVANEGLQKSVSGMTQTIGIADGGVTTVKIADNAVTSAKILDGTITSADLSADLFSAVKKDTIVGNEVTDAANATLTRSGSGKDADPYKLAVNPTATADSIA